MRFDSQQLPGMAYLKRILNAVRIKLTNFAGEITHQIREWNRFAPMGGATLCEFGHLSGSFPVLEIDGWPDEARAGWGLEESLMLRFSLHCPLARGWLLLLHYWTKLSWISDVRDSVGGKA